MTKGDKFKIDRFNDGQILEWEVQRVCRMHVNVFCDKYKWCMPNNRIKDIIKTSEGKP